MSKNTKSLEQYRITEQAYIIAKTRAKAEDISICKWVSKAIMEKALLDDMLETTAKEEIEQTK